MKEFKDSTIDIDTLGAGLGLTDGADGDLSASVGLHLAGQGTAAASPKLSATVKTGKKFWGKKTDPRGEGCPVIDDAGWAERETEASQSPSGMTLADLEGAIKKGWPVVVLIQAWSGYTVDKYATGWDSGHYVVVVVVGYDKDRVYFMDPEVFGNYAYMSKADFKKRWHDYDGSLAKDYSRCPGGIELHNFGLIVQSNQPAAFARQAIERID